jgi:tRNA G18 (ribose-2'-O)-methylase SpoU
LGAAVPLFDVSSPSDPRLAPYQHVSDVVVAARAGLFIAEGRLVVERLLASLHLHTQSVLVTPAAYHALAHALEARPEVPVLRAPQAVVNEVSGHNIHRGCLAVAERPAPREWTELVEGARLVVVLEGVGDADNVGSAFRSASAFGVDAVLVGPACADPLYRKAIRTSMAATLTMPFGPVSPWPRALGSLRDAGWHIVGLTPRPDAPALHTVADPHRTRPTALLFGTEGDGLTAAALDACSTLARIPMVPGHDSLNVAVSVAVALYEMTRHEDDRR